MPDDAPHADDISDLWGADQRGTLDRLRPAPPARHRNPADPAAVNGNGSHGGRGEPQDELVKLVEAVAAYQVNAELDAVSERITAVQDDLCALHEAVADLKKTVDRQGRRSRGRVWLGRTTETVQMDKPDAS